MKYFIGGFTWNKISQFDRFIKNGIWENGYQEDKYSEIFLKIRVGDLFALKSTYQKKGKSYLRIKKIGVVIQIVDTHTIKINWYDNIKEFDLTDIRWYANTLEEITNGIDIYRIFGNVKTVKMIQEIKTILENKKQIILQGAPGTGKTYTSAEIALSIVNNEVKNYSSREELMKEYKKAIENEYIMFTTFHQSLDYEEFIEGIKPIIDNESDNIVYSIENGLFKKLCKKATLKASIQQEVKIDKQAKIWKMSLGEAGQKKTKLIRDYCFENNIVALGFCVSKIKFTGKDGDEILEEMHKIKPDCEKKDAEKTSRLINVLKENDIIIVPGDNLKSISGIAKVKTKYGVLSNEYPDFMQGYEQYREVEWLAKNIDLRIDEFTNKGSQQLGRGTLIENKTINIEKLLKNITSNTDNNYVLIIDEINRGNISKIFGELITLLENDKRLGGNNEIILKLPYSKKDFGIPSNLFIIGTMNTADRSVGYIDYAVRRRFAFITLKSDINVIEEYYKDKDELKNYASKLYNKVENLFSGDNLSPDYKKDDIMIGHSYFLADDLDSLKIKLEYEIKPLLLEYLKDGIFISDEIEEKINQL